MEKDKAITACVLTALIEHGPLTRFRLDTILNIAGFPIGPRVFRNVEAMERAGLILVQGTLKQHVLTIKGHRIYRIFVEKWP